MPQPDLAKIHVLFVCMGNICRSPAAECIFRQYVEMRGHSDRFVLDSAGTIASHAGEKPDRRMVRAGKQRGTVIEGRARQFTPEDFDLFNYIVVMDQSNHFAVESQARSEAHRQKLFLMSDFHPEPDVMEVPDPYSGGPEGFDLVLDLLEDACRYLLQRIEKDHAL